MIGPSMPASFGPVAPSSSSFAGPHLPAPDSDSDDDFSPSLPPDMLAARSSTASSKPVVAGPVFPGAQSSSKKVMGPSLPSNYMASSSSASRKETPLSARYLDDDDDSFGPQPLPAGMMGSMIDNDGAREFREREEREEEKKRKATEGKEKMKREEWMMVPPEDVDLLSTMDSTKLKSRTFQQSAKVTSSSRTGSSGGTNLWTETPAERQQRMEDEMLGKKRKAEVSAAGGGDHEDTDDQRRKRERDWQLREEVERHNKSARSTTLLDAHSKSKRAETKEEKNGSGIWDRDRDMSVGGRLLDDSKRSETIKGAKELGGRFSSGSYL